MKPNIRYYGGKSYQADWICDVLRQYKFHTYIEPFGGSGAILFAKPPSPVEIYNDLNFNLVTMYRVIRNPDTLKEFTAFVENSPYARKILEESCAVLRVNDSLSDVERAGHFFVTVRQCFSGDQQGHSWSMIGKIGKQQAVPYRQAIDRLPEIHARLRNVQIEHLDAIECITRYACHNTMTYCDPPYVADTRISQTVYFHEMTDEQHMKLVQTLLTAPGHKLLSGYASPIYQPLLDAGWTCLKRDFVCQASFHKTPRTECLYCSPNTKPKITTNFSIINKVIT